MAKVRRLTISVVYYGVRVVNEDLIIYIGVWWDYI